jgi:tRNA(adenine34) deaminase
MSSAFSAASSASAASSVAPKQKRECPFSRIFPSALARDDAFFMALAYNQALEAWREDEVPVGAVIERNGEIIAAAHNAVDTLRDPTAHAEILAITQAAAAIGDWRLNECTLYVTKEPCPMCAGATIMARLGKVVFAQSDPKMGCLGGATAIHELKDLNHHPIVTHGTMHQECANLLRAYFAEKRSSRETFADT